MIKKQNANLAVAQVVGQIILLVKIPGRILVDFSLGPTRGRSLFGLKHFLKIKYWYDFIALYLEATILLFVPSTFFRFKGMLQHLAHNY